jgi:antitoxin component HigA of HigAB toxin-antitoxin module
MPSELVVQDEPSKEEFDDVFADLPPLEGFDFKKHEIAAQLAALLSFANKTRSAIASELQWKKSRVSNVLSGRSNLTVKTVYEFCSSLGFDFDVTFRRPSESRPKQPWQGQALTMPVIQQAERPLLFMLRLQRPSEVATDLWTGSAGIAYSRVDEADTTETRGSLSMDVGARSLTSSSPSRVINVGLMPEGAGKNDQAQSMSRGTQQQTPGVF